MNDSDNKPHILTLSTWNGDDYDGEDFGCWDDVTIICPHYPAVAIMPCAVWEPCGCAPARIGELDFYDEEITDQDWPCSRSPTGKHHYVEDEPFMPIARCFADEWEGEISDVAFNMGLPAGTYLVRPWWDGWGFRLDLIDPLINGG
jgi:hypothetical protein